MNKTFRIYGIILVIVLVILGLLEVNKTEVIDWRKNFDIHKKTPFGLYVFNQEVNGLLKNVERVEESPFNYYKQNPNLSAHNILVFNKHFDDESWKKILEQTEKGANVLVINKVFYSLPDTIDVSYEYLNDIDEDKKLIFHLLDKKMKNSILIDKAPSGTGFKEINSGQKILGYIEKDGKKVSFNFIQVPFGKGDFYLHSEPLILTNYYLLKPEGHKYVENIFSYLPNNKTIWFTENYNKKRESQSPLRFILQNDNLRHAWQLLLVGLLLFALFNIRRKQRIVPIIEPLKNKSVEFVKSIGNLYLQEGTPHDMALKKIQYFLNKVRLDLMIDTQHLDDNFIKKLHLKTGKNIELIQEAVDLINKIQNQHIQVKHSDLAKINEVLDKILKS